ncbi:MAG: hypothetical protein KAJ64_03925, partial [Thermoplasmata archaeon]|nr:hypothetical protein [Thermoplasmata archaeon]
MGLFSKKPELQPGQVPCPHCQRALEWSPPNNQWFCQKCDLFVASDAKRPDALNEFASELTDLFDDKPKHYCDSCRDKLDWSSQYNRWFCA